MHKITPNYVSNKKIFTLKSSRNYSLHKFASVNLLQNIQKERANKYKIFLPSGIHKPGF